MAFFSLPDWSDALLVAFISVFYLVVMRPQAQNLSEVNVIHWNWNYIPARYGGLSHARETKINPACQTVLIWWHSITTNKRGKSGN